MDGKKCKPIWFLPSLHGQSKREGFNYEPWHYSFAPLSIPMLEEYLKLDLINLLTPNDLSGKSCIDEKFLESYINENV